MSDGAQASASAAPALASASASAPTSQAAPAPEGAPAPPYKRIQYAVLGRDGLEFKQGPNKRRDDLVDKDDADARFASAQQITPVRNFEYSSDDGSKVVVHQTTGFSVLDTDSGALVCRVERAGLLKVGVSPRGSFVLTWEKHQSGNKEGNMIVWRVADGAVVFRAFEKNLLDTTWPLVKWSSDEKVAAHLITNNVCMYDGASFDKYHKIKDEGVTQFALCKLAGDVSEENPCKVSTFKPATSGGPAKISVFNYVGEPVDRAVGMKTTFKADHAAFAWSKKCNAVLCKVETDVDTTGKSYYGESALFLLHADGSSDCKVMPGKENGFFHDFAWSPHGKVFVAISGSSPSSCLLYNLKGEAIFDFGMAHRNTIKVSPHGRFLCLGGFGNLSGDMDFWDMNKKTKMGSVRANCAVSQEWSPCGRFFMTGTLFPRLRVENGVTFYTYRGEELYKISVREANKVLWRPAAHGVYPDRPQTPLKKGQKAPLTNGATPSAQPKVEEKKKAAGVYRPPGSSGGLAALMRKEREGGTAARKINVPSANGAGAGAGAKPGMTKAALRRERKKKAEAARKEAADAEADADA